MPDWLFRSLQAAADLAETLTWAGIGFLVLCASGSLLVRSARWAWRRWR